MPSCRRCEDDAEVELVHPRRARPRRRRSKAPSSAATACGSTAGCARATCGTRSCAAPTTMPSPACCSWTASTRTTTWATARPSSATNPCGEQPLPSYGCCCLGSIDLTHFVTRPFEDDAAFDEAALVEVVTVATRMLDNVLDVTVWPLAAAAPGSHPQAPHRPGLHRPGRCTGHAQPALRQRRRARTGPAHRRGDARCGLRRVGGAGARARRLPAVQCRPVPERRHLRLAPAAAAEGAHPPARACATRTCCRSRPPAPSAWPLPTTPATASSRPSAGATRARSAKATAASRSSRSRTTPGGCTAT